MYIPFDEMPDTARVWIYQANRSLNATEEDYAFQLGQQFANRWAAHGQPLQASVQLFHRYFLVVAVDEQHYAASGCSIDSSVAFVRELEQKFTLEQFALSFFDRTQIAFWQDEQVHLIPMAQAKMQIKEGDIQPDAITFDNNVPNKEAFNIRWKIPVKSSWLARYLPKVPSA